MTKTTNIQTLHFNTDDGLGSLAKIGLIVLQSDQTIEHEFATLFQDDNIAIYHSRIPNDTEVTPETLRNMEAELPRAAALLPSDFKFDAIGYACTSGATMIGEDRVDQIIRSEHKGAKTSNPISACKSALSALGLKRIALVTPYAPSVTLEMQANLRADGFETVSVASFNQTDDFTVARIASHSILDAVLQAGANNDCDGVFVSCTSLRALSIIKEAEAAIGKPVISSNQAMAWHLMRLAGLNHRPIEFGKIFGIA